MRIVVTGATGFIGSEIIRQLIRKDEVGLVYALIRRSGNKSAEDRFQQILNHWQKYFAIDENHLAKIKVIEADLLGNPFEIAEKVRDTSYVFHCAASTDIGMPLRPARQTNLVGTQKMLQWAQKLPSLKRIVHFSTAYVLGAMTGPLRESDIPIKFNNGYEQSKYEAEQVVRTSGLPYTIVRPSLVVGDSNSGYVRGYKIIYAALRAWLTDTLLMAPLDPKAPVDIVPVDYVVAASFKLAQLSSAQNEVFHLTSGRNARYTMDVFQYAINTFGLTSPKLIYPQVAGLLTRPWLYPLLGHRLRQIVDLMKSHIPYLGTRNRYFLTDKVDEILKPQGITCPELNQFGSTIFEFCRDSNWGKLALRKVESHV